MQLDLSKEDLELLQKALESHERIGVSDNALIDIMGTIILGPEAKNPQYIAERQATKLKAEREQMQIKGRCLMLRARLAEIASREAEFPSPNPV